MVDKKKFGVVKPADPGEVKRLEAEKKAKIQKAREEARAARMLQAERAKVQAAARRRGTMAGVLNEALKGKELKRG